MLFKFFWYISGNKVKTSDIEAAAIRLAGQNGLQFQKIIEGLTTYQLNFLKALCKGTENLHSKASIKMSSLGATATIQRSIQALLQKDVIDVMGKQMTMVDPAFRWWFPRNFPG